jgi:hypothetical protein
MSSDHFCSVVGCGKDRFHVSTSQSNLVNVCSRRSATLPQVPRLFSS